MITVLFGLEISDRFYPADRQIQLIVGERGFLSFLESQLALHHSDKEEFLRVEQYRQLLQSCLDGQKGLFYSESFQSNGLATANMLLQMRDELKLAGWDFKKSPQCPERLEDFSSIESQIHHSGQKLSVGFADRFAEVEKLLKKEKIALQKLFLVEPLGLFPAHWRRLLQLLAQNGVEVCQYQRPDLAQTASNDLQQLQLFINKQPIQPSAPKADGSVLILRARHESEGSQWLSKTAQLNPQWRPLLLIPAQSKGLDIAMIREGLPSMGLINASQARPTLQLLKLAIDFVWRPIDPYKLLEFLNLPNKPLHEQLSRKIAEVVSKKPGIFSDSWRAAVKSWFEQIEQKAQEQPQRATELRQEAETARKQYEFWFDRARTDSKTGTVAARTIIFIFDFIQDWAKDELNDCKERAKKADDWINRLKTQEQNPSKLRELEQQKEQLQQTSLHFTKLIEQSSRLAQILETLPKDNDRLSPLELERLIKYIDEPTAMQYRSTEQQSWDFVQQPSAIGQCEQLIWWDFVKTAQAPLFSRWYPKEKEFLQQLGLALDSPDLAQQRRLWQQKQPILAAQQRLILFIPDFIEGEEQEAHRLLADLQSLWGDLSPISQRISSSKEEKQPELSLLKPEQLPDYELITPSQWEQVEQILDLGQALPIGLREEESFSSLERIINQPHEWLFQYILELRRSPILSVVSEETLRGNLAHNIISDFVKDWQQQLQTEPKAQSPQSVSEWLEQNGEKYMEREGAIFNLYGKEPERVDFLQRLQRSLWSLVETVQTNGWKVKETEKTLLGKLGEQNIKGIADLVLEKNNGELAIVDLKWKSSKYWLETLKNKSDLQLALYAHLLAQNSPEQAHIHTAYMSLLDGKTVARDKTGFKNAQLPSSADNNQQVIAELTEKIAFTVQKQLEILQQGKLITQAQHGSELLDFQDQLKMIEPTRQNYPNSSFELLINPLG